MRTEFTKAEKAVLGKPHPKDFGIPSDQWANSQSYAEFFHTQSAVASDNTKPCEATKQLTGGKVNYYLVQVAHPQRETQAPYQAECEDIIRALNMTFDEGCEFKAIWRTAAARLGNGKPGQAALYDAEKRVHYASASLRQYQRTT